MVIRGNSRGNARQLSHYLLAMKDNEAIRILDVDGQWDAKAEDLHRAVFAMGISAELSRSEKGLYHAQINPAIGEDAAMSDAAWMQAGDMLGKQLGLENQRRAIVLHSKKGRTHAHVVWERYDHEKEKMVSESFSRLAQDRARKEMEAAFGHAPTPHRNRHRPELKASLTGLWQQCGTGAQFVKAARANRYLIAAGSGRSPYVVVDENGRSYDLARQLTGIRLKEIRQRLRGEELLGEKDAIIAARNAAGNRGQRDGERSGKQELSFKPKPHPMKQQFADDAKEATGGSQGSKPTGREAAARDGFAQNRNDATQDSRQPQQQPRANPRKDFAANKMEATGQQPVKTIQDKFAENKGDAAKSANQQGGGDTRREDFEKRMQAMKEKQAKDKNKGLDMG